MDLDLVAIGNHAQPSGAEHPSGLVTPNPSGAIELIEQLDKTIRCHPDLLGQDHGFDRFVTSEQEPEGSFPHPRLVFHQRLKHAFGTHAAQQLSLATSRVKVWAASLKPSAKVR